MNEYMKREETDSWIRAGEEVLRVCQKYPYLWDEEDVLEDNSFHLFNLIHYDEYEYISIEKGESTLFGDFYFASSWKYQDPAQVAAHNLEDVFRNFKITSESFKERFYSNLENILSKYLSKKEIKKLTGFKSQKDFGKYLAREEIKKIRNLTNLAS